MSEEEKTPEVTRQEELNKLFNEIWTMLDGCTVGEINAIAQSINRQASLIKISTKIKE